MFLLAVPGVLALICGTGAAVAADRCHEKLRMQRLGGGLIVSGVAIIGMAFPLIA
jgi:hypothetical protein